MNIRNVGIMAHIDAGKTTTIERILYYTGMNYKIGDVDSGDTVTDWMPQEQERGITITSASITCFWRNCQINIIDTPGHVDFTAEVERTLRILDGGIIVFSAVDGIQAQTETVWRQASKYSIPKVAYVNKMDRIGANFFKIVTDIKNKFKIRPIIMQIPIGNENQFEGVIDLLQFREIHFEIDTLGFTMNYKEIRPSLKRIASKYKEKLIDDLSEFSEELTELYLHGHEVPVDLIQKELRKNTILLNVIPIFLGSSLKNIGIQPLIDSIVNYLPNPNERQLKAFDLNTKREILVNSELSDKFSALVFKIQYSTQLATHLYFLRVYSGELNSNCRILNIVKNKREKITKIFRVSANKNDSVESIRTGDIGAVLGLKFSVTGDTLVEENNNILLENVIFPEPVVSITIEPMKSSEETRLKEVLRVIVKEDPTFSFKEDVETGQILISGMGELHLDIIITRIKEDFKLEVYTSKPQVTYRETISKVIEEVFEFNNIFSNKVISLKINMRLSPLKIGEGNKVEILCDLDLNYQAILGRGIKLAYSSGALGYPIVDTLVQILDLVYDKNKINETALEAITGLAFHSLFLKAGSLKLEPIMQLEIRVSSEYTGEAISALNSVNGVVNSVENMDDDEIIKADAPFEKLFGFTTVLRNATKGKGVFTMSFSCFKEKLI